MLPGINESRRLFKERLAMSLQLRALKQVLAEANSYASRYYQTSLTAQGALDHEPSATSP